MLNKELLLTTENQPAGSIKLTVGRDDISEIFGYYEAYSIGTLSRIPTWNLEGEPVAMTTLASYVNAINSVLVFDYLSRVGADSITVTVVEKGLTVTFYWSTRSQTYVASEMVFIPSDVGKTFTIVFDPEPTGYV